MSYYYDWRIGDNITCHIEVDSTRTYGTVTISGSGAMYEYHNNSWGQAVISYIPLDTDDQYAIDDGFINYNYDDIWYLWRRYGVAAFNFRNIIINDNITSIGPNFWSVLDSAYLPNIDMSYIENITIGSSVTRICDAAFGGFVSNAADPNDWHHFITIRSNSISYVGNSAFQGCPETHLDFNSSLTYLGRSAFEGCTGLESTGIININCSILNSTFRLCWKLTSFCQDNYIQDLEQRHGIVDIIDTFISCQSLERIKFNDNITFDTSNAFYPFMVDTTNPDWPLSNPDLNGRQKTIIETNSQSILNFDWTTWGRVLVSADVDLIKCAHNGRYIEIQMYDAQISDLKIIHNGSIKYLKKLPKNDPNGSPLRIVDRGVIYSIGY